MMSGLVKSMNIHQEGDGDWVEAVIFLLLSELIEMDIEALNDYTEHVLFEDGSAMLSNIGYSVAGCDADNNTVDVKVTADLEYWE